MARATKLLAVTTLLAATATGWLYLDNRKLRDQLATRPAAAEAADASTIEVASADDSDPWVQPEPRAARIPTTTPTKQPALPAVPKESRLDRRQRRLQEFSAMFGRHDGETEEEYRARIGPMVTAGLAIPRMRVAESRRAVEDKAGVTAQQSKQLDQAFDEMYGEVIDYTNKAITDGLLSPYERNVAGWLDYAGGLGGMLSDAQGRIGKVLTPDQIKAISGSGFEWGEYLGVSAPWEKLNPPPPPPR